MKFLRYIKEDTNDKIDLDELESCIDMIKKKCKPYISELKKSNINMKLYRGMKKQIIDCYDIKKVRKDRMPKDTPDGFHNLLNDAFYNKFKVKLRSESIFCTGKGNTAKEYGTPYIVVPIGKFDIYGSNDMEDLYTNTEEISDEYRISELKATAWEEGENKYGEDDNGHGEFEGKEYSGYFDDVMNSIKSEEEYKEGNVLEIENKMEGIPDINEEDYVKQYVEGQKEKLEKELDDIVDTYNKGNIRNAIISGNEIMVDCKEYMIVKDKYIPYLEYYFLGECDNEYIYTVQTALRKIK